MYPRLNRQNAAHAAIGSSVFDKVWRYQRNMLDGVSQRVSTVTKTLFELGVL